MRGQRNLNPLKIAIPSQCPIDYMHAVLEGVTKKLMQNYWFCSKHHGKRFYLLKDVHEIDKRLQRIKPPHDFRSTPRPISKTLNFWKASEYQAFLLYCAIPVLMCFFPSDYLYHLALLVCSTHTTGKNVKFLISFHTGKTLETQNESFPNNFNYRNLAFLLWFPTCNKLICFQHGSHLFPIAKTIRFPLA